MELMRYLRENAPSIESGGVSICLYGVGRAGKSHMIDLLTRKFLMPRCPEAGTIVITTSPDSIPIKRLVSEMDLPMIEYGITDDIFKDIFREHELRKARWNIVLDDVLSVREDERFKDLILRRRNAGFNTMNATQYYTHLKPETRATVNYVFLMKCNNFEAVDKYIQIYLYPILNSISRDKELMKAFYIQHTSSRNFFFMDFLEMKFFTVYSRKEGTEFMLGSLKNDFFNYAR